MLEKEKYWFFEFEVILGFIILFLGAFLMAQELEYLPEKFFLPESFLKLATAGGSIIGGGYLMLKKLFGK